MYSSVKFFEPTVSLTPALSGLFSISPAEVVVVSSSSPPQAEMPTARATAARTANSTRSRWLMLIAGASLRIDWSSTRAGPLRATVILCLRAPPLQHQPARRHQTLHPCERELDSGRQ